MPFQQLIYLVATDARQTATSPDKKVPKTGKNAKNHAMSVAVATQMVRAVAVAKDKRYAYRAEQTRPFFTVFRLNNVKLMPDIHVHVSRCFSPVFFAACTRDGVGATRAFCRAPATKKIELHSNFAQAQGCPTGDRAMYIYAKTPVHPNLQAHV